MNILRESQRNVLQKCLNRYGVEEQQRMAMEECAELIQAINKVHRKPSPENMNNLFEEIADVTIMIEQLKMIYLVHDCSTIERIIEEKIDRQKGRLEN